MELIQLIQTDIRNVLNRDTIQFRNIAKKYKKEISQLQIAEIYEICEALLEERTWGSTTIAYQIIYDAKSKYDGTTFERFESWLYQYISDWWDCDDFMTHAFQELLMKYPTKIKQIKKWVNCKNFAVRRSAAVILIRPAKKGLLEKNVIFEICDLLISDTHDLVRKGIGWLLKESIYYYYDDVVHYLETKVERMSRTTFRYAIEKMKEEDKKRLMSL
ncbi:MAG: DNA alkylation repair protein [Bacilli bacterium]|nr:DNA alkylation repair protein [Bacilli bacterium]